VKVLEFDVRGLENRRVSILRNHRYHNVNNQSTWFALFTSISELWAM